MKTISALLLLITLTTSVSFAKTREPKKEVKIISDKKHTVFFKVDKSFVGGKVEIYNADMKFLEADEVPHVLNKVYFDEAPAGDYVIKVKKGNKSFVLEYHNF